MTKEERVWVARLLRRCRNELRAYGYMTAKSNLGYFMDCYCLEAEAAMNRAENERLKRFARLGREYAVKL